MREFHGGDRGADRFRDGEGAVQVGVGQQDRKLLAAKTRRDVSGAVRAGLHRLADHLQAGVARHMPVVVIESLEIIDVDHHQRNRRLVAYRPLEFGVQPLVEMTSVGQAGETVAQGQQLQRRIGRLERGFGAAQFALQPVALDQLADHARTEEQQDGDQDQGAGQSGRGAGPPARKHLVFRQRDRDQQRVGAQVPVGVEPLHLVDVRGHDGAGGFALFLP
jgi:hypothetical protein